MKAAGIVSEYNPFHLGHLYHIEKTRKACGEDTVIICALSGDFVQRGEPSVISKFARAESALRCGADLIIELPSVWALQSAEGYAEAALSILSAMGVSFLSFGTETDDPAALERIAGIISEESFETALAAAVKEHSGISYASVREEVLRSFAGDDAELLKTPNNILAVEYMKAVFRNSYDISFLPVKRNGAGHDEVSGDGIRSASDIRAKLLNGEDTAPFVPDASYKIIDKEIRRGRGPVSLKSLEQAVVSKLRGISAGDLMKMTDCDEELASRIISAVSSNYALNDVFSAARTKKYAHSRVRRVCICAALGITEEMQQGRPPYLRILAASRKGQLYLKELKKNRPEVPLAAKAADIRKLGERCAECIRIDSGIHDIYVLGYSNPDEMICGMDYRHSPVML